jgi:hypothetical protein
MFFEYETGYQVSDLLGQIKCERKVAGEMGLQRRHVLLGHMENLVCYFYGCNSIGKPVIEPGKGMSPSLIKMKMANDARPGHSLYLKRGPVGIRALVRDHRPEIPSEKHPEDTHQKDIQVSMSRKNRTFLA